MDLPDSVVISEEGPREGFQIEPGPIATADKIALIDALSACGLRRIQVGSFVNSKHVPGWADAEAVIEGFTAREGVEYSAVWFNEAGMQRALGVQGETHPCRIRFAERVRTVRDQEPQSRPRRADRGDAQILCACTGKPACRLPRSS